MTAATCEECGDQPVITRIRWLPEVSKKLAVRIAALALLFTCVALPVTIMSPMGSSYLLRRVSSIFGARPAGTSAQAFARQLEGVVHKARATDLPRPSKPDDFPLRLVMQKVHKMASEQMVLVFKELNNRAGLPRETISEGFPIGQYLEKKPGRKAFVISSVRNPCDWYVSYWKYESFQRTPIPDYLMGRKEFGGSSNATRFREYMVSKMARGPPFMSWLVVKNMIDQETPRSKPPCDLLGYKAGRCNEHDFYWKRLKEHPPEDGLIDCMVYVEDLYGGVRRCLNKYEAVSNITLNWKAIDEYFDLMTNSKHKANSVGGLPCSDYYTPELAAYVMQKDRGLFSAFNYTTCCNKHA